MIFIKPGFFVDKNCKKSSQIILLFLFNSTHATTTLISPHSSTDNLARYLVGWEHLIDNTTNESYVTFGIIPEVTQSFREERIAQCLFGDLAVEHKITFTVSGSLTPSRGSTDWLADYFGLPPDFISSIHVKPSVNNVIVNFSAYFGLNGILNGLYAFIHGPIEYTRWDINMRECIVQSGIHGYDPGYFNAAGIERSALLSDFTSYLKGKTPHGSGITFVPLNNAKIPRKSLKRINLAEVQVALGYNLFANPYYHFGGFAFFGIPAGNKPKGKFLFEPIVGNGHLWQLGVGFTGHIIVWCNEENDEQVGIYGGFMLSHLFKTNQIRSFDVCNKPNSRYMLAAHVGTSITNQLAGLKNGAFISPIAQFKQLVSPVANLTISPITISIPWYLDFALMLSYTKCNVTWSFGYGIWGRGCDRILRKPCSKLDDSSMQWVLKGDSQMIAFESITNAPISLSSSQSNATISSAGNINAASQVTSSQNNYIDNPLPAFSDSTNSMIFIPVMSTPNGIQQINTSIQPKLLTAQNIDTHSAQTRGFSKKIFGHFSYQCPSKNSIIPYLGFGAQAELGPHHNKSNNCQKSCTNSALSFWSVWLKGGAQFH